MPNIKIFQAYYLQDQLSQLDNEFVPYNNTSNLEGDYREYPIFKDLYNIGVNENLDLWGYFSWKWKEKLYGLKALDIKQQVEKYPGYDVYFWNPFSEHAVFFFNVWEQGQIHHPHLITIMEHIFPKLGLDPNWVYQPMHPDVIWFGLYCVGNKKFWQGFLDFADIYKNSIDQLPYHIKNLHNSGAQYEYFPTLWYFPFIHERLLSTYLTINYPDLKIWHYHHRKDDLGYIWDRLYHLKTMAIKYKEVELLKEWQHLRYQLGVNCKFSEQWVSKFDKNLLNIYNKL